MERQIGSACFGRNTRLPLLTKEKAAMTKQELAGRMQENSAWVPGKRVKLDFGSEGVILLDGAASQVTEEDGPADTTIKVGWEDWHDGVHDRQAQDRGRHVQRDAAAGRARQAARLVD
jgi:hypothetical protein